MKFLFAILIIGFFGFPLMLALSLVSPKLTTFWMQKKTKKKAVTLYSVLTIVNFILIIFLAALLNPSRPGLVSLSHDDFEPWPYTLTGEVICMPQSRETQHLVLKTPDGQLYAINGLARSSGQYQDVNNFWKDDPTQPGLKINVDQVISRGLALCR